MDISSHWQESSSLKAFFQPQSVAVVGVTEREGSVGRSLLENLSGFPGTLHVVHPTRKEVLGRPTVASLGEVASKVDLVVLATPAPSIPGLIQQAGACGIRAAVVISAGFKETGSAGIELEAQVLKAAREGGVRVLGPNCLGLMSPQSGVNATFAAVSACPGRVAFLSQSGALCTAILDWSIQKQLGFSAFVSVGSMLDVGWGDLIRYFGEDPHTDSIVLYMESVGDAAAFVAAAREVSQRKPIVAIKVGRTAEASRAAASHTGSMTGCDAVLDAAFEQSGVIRVDSIEELFDTAEILAKQSLPPGARLAVLTNAGGPAALATDALVRFGGSLAQLAPDTLASLNTLLPAHWSHSNPVDILGDADACRYEACLRMLLSDSQTDGVLVILTPQAMTTCLETARAVARLASESTKPVFASWMGGPAVVGARAVFDAAAIPNFPYPDEAARAWQYLDEYRQRRNTARQSLDAALKKRPVLEKVVNTVEDLVRPRARTLSEVDSKRILLDAGIPVLETFAAHSEQEAVEYAHRVGFPVVLKLLSDTITHKSDVGGVRLNLLNVEAVRSAWRTIQDAVQESDFYGVSVQRMVFQRGIELICGSTVDAQFGPVLMCGAGGVYTEIFQDRVLFLPPLSPDLFLNGIRRTRIFKALKGTRGMPPVDWDSLAQVMVALGDLVLSVPRIREIDINPLLSNDLGVLALDARVALAPDGRQPALAVSN